MKDEEIDHYICGCLELQDHRMADHMERQREGRSDSDSDPDYDRPDSDHDHDHDPQ